MNIVMESQTVKCIHKQLYCNGHWPLTFHNVRLVIKEVFDLISEAVNMEDIAH